MGNCNFKPEQETDNVTAINKNHFMFHYVIGRGGFGKVWKVEKKKEKKPFAMKEMHKGRIIQKRSVNSVMNEKKFLTQLYHPFLVNMHYAFQDRENLYLVIDIMQGGDLRYHFAKHRKFTEEQTKFFMACMLLCLEFLHSKSILHRDIKPENLVFDEAGYMKVTDLGIARVWNPDNAKDTSGTPGYMAPEVMCRQNHGVAVDYFAMGVIGYECMYGKRPYVGKTRKEIRDHILSKQIQIRKNEVPPGWSLEAADFINKLIQRKPINRLGLNGPIEVKEHVWFKNFNWDDLLNRKMVSPFLPPNEDNFDAKYTNSDWKDNNEEQMRQNSLLLRRNSVQALFNGYYHDDNIAAINAKNPPPRMIEEHVPSSASSNVLSPNTQNTTAQQKDGSVVQGDASAANSATNSNINTLQQSIHHNIQQQNAHLGQNSHFNSVNNPSVKRSEIMDRSTSGNTQLKQGSMVANHQFSQSVVNHPDPQNNLLRESARLKNNSVVQTNQLMSQHQQNLSMQNPPMITPAIPLHQQNVQQQPQQYVLQQHAKNHQAALNGQQSGATGNFGYPSPSFGGPGPNPTGYNPSAPSLGQQPQNHPNSNINNNFNAQFQQQQQQIGSMRGRPVTGPGHIRQDSFPNKFQ